MTTQSNKSEISKALLANAQIKDVKFDKKDFKPTNRGHGLFVITEGNDTLIDLRMSSEKPFWGHTHPLTIQHNYNNLEFDLIENNYSVPKTDFTRMIETFQRVSILEVLKPDFKITYHNVVITIDESILKYDKAEISNVLSSLINSNPTTFFWLVEKDLLLLSESSLFYLEDIMNKKQVHLCLDLHFISSIFIYSHHLFSEDENIQIFLGLKNLVEKIVSTKINGKNSLDFKVIDTFLENEVADKKVSRVGRYLIVKEPVSSDKFHKNGIVLSQNSNNDCTILAIPYSCTENELIDTLNRIKLSI